MRSEPGKETITLNILPNISTSKNNQTGQLISIAWEKLKKNQTQNVVEKITQNFSYF